MGGSSDKADVSARLQAAKRKAEELQALQAQAAREIAEAEALEAEQAAELEVIKEQRAKEALHRVSKKAQQDRSARRRKSTSTVDDSVSSSPKSPAATVEARAITAVDNDDEQFESENDEYDEYEDEPVDEFHEETGSRRKRIGLKCFNCNRLEGHYLLFYRRLWYSYIVGMTFGLAIIAGPYRCQCCGSSRLMMSNFLHPKFYLSLFKTRSKSRSGRRSSRR